MKCQICKEDLPSENFRKAQINKTHSNPICKKCQYEKNKVYNDKKKNELNFDRQFFKVIG